MGLDQLFCLFHIKVLSVHVFAVRDNSVKELDMVSDGKILGISNIFLNGFIHSCVEPVMGGVVEAICENLERHVVLTYTKSPQAEASSLYRKRSSYNR